MIQQTDIDEIGLESESIIATWETRFQMQYHEETIIANAVKEWLSADDATRRAMRRTNPQMYDIIVAKAKRMREKLQSIVKGVSYA